MTEQLRDEDRVRHMLEAAMKAAEFARGQSRSTLDADEKLTLSLVHLLEILGEAAGKISQDFRQRHPEIPWNRVSAIRNRLIHGYFDIDLDIVWETVTNQAILTGGKTRFSMCASTATIWKGSSTKRRGWE